MVMEKKRIMGERDKRIRWFPIDTDLCEGQDNQWQILDKGDIILERVGEAEVDREEHMSIREIKEY